MGRAKAVLAEMCREVLSEDIAKLRREGREGGTLGKEAVETGTKAMR